MAQFMCSLSRSYFVSYYWQDFTVGQAVPKEAVQVGSLPDNSAIYVGRTMFKNELQTVTFYAAKNEAFLSFNHGVERVFEFHLLMNYLPQFEPIWSKSGRGYLPENAIECGFNISNEPLYVARIWKDGNPHPGKYHAADNKCHFVNGDSEGNMPDCDVLVSRIDRYHWIATTKDQIPADWFVVTQDAEGHDVGVAYTYHENERTLVKITPATGLASIGYDGKEVELDNNQIIHVLVQHVKRKPLEWHHVELGADYGNRDVVRAGYTNDGRVIHVGRYQRDGVYVLCKLHSNWVASDRRRRIKRGRSSPEVSYHWQDFTVGQAVPKDAVQVGSLPDNSAIYIGRAMFKNELQTVTFYAAKHEAFLSFNGGVEKVFEFQLLMNYLPQFEPIWSKSGRGHLPKNAIECGFTISNEPLYVARIWKDGYPHPGKYAPAKNKCHFVDGDREGNMPDCDVLVSRIDRYHWIATTKDQIPADWFVVTQDAEGHDVGVAYTYYENERNLVKITPATGLASIGYDGKEVQLDNNQIIYVLVQHVKRKPLAWYHVQSGANYANLDIVQAGYTKDGRVIHVGRYQRDGVYVLCKVIRHDNIICIPINGVEEVHTGAFDILYLPTLN